MLSLLFWMLVSSVAAPAQVQTAEPAPAPPQLSMPNHFASPERCPSIPRQVMGEDRRYPGTRLGDQPPGRLLLAVDRRVEGCPVVTFVSDERQRLQRR